MWLHVAAMLVASFAASSLGPNHAAQFNPATVTWRVRATTHFEIYYAQARDLDSIAREAERAYVRVSRDLRREISAKVPLILLPTSGDLPQTEQEAAVIVRASGAPPRDHLLLPVEPRNGRETMLAHELTHIFEFEERSRHLAVLEAGEDVSTAETTLKMSSWWSANPSSHGHELTSYSLFSNVVRHSPSSKIFTMRKRCPFLIVKDFPPLT